MKKIVIIGIVTLLFTLNGYGSEPNKNLFNKKKKELIEADKENLKIFREAEKKYLEYSEKHLDHDSKESTPIVINTLKLGFEVTKKYDPVMKSMIDNPPKNSKESNALKKCWESHLHHQEKLINLAIYSLNLLCTKEKN